MTDYLEEHLERSGALLEQVRRMEQSLPGPPVEGEPEGSAGGSDPLGAERGAAELVSESEREVDGLKEKVDRLEKMVDDAGLNEEFPEEQAGATGDWQNDGETAAQGFQEGPGADYPEHAGAAAVQTNQEKAEPGGVPLLEQLEELDRAAASWAVMTAGEGRLERFRWGGGERQSGYPVSLAGPRSAAVPEEVWSGGGLSGSAGAEQEWAERADRAFRRDSRRYDGGFSLY